ncbi:MAG: toll/interleukin-1 receptor domain-containing protein [Sedimentisphaerales bacterium]|jgi:hypothetical protein
MNIILYAEERFNANISVIADNLNKICKKVKFSIGKSTFKINSSVITSPGTYRNLDPKIKKESKRYSKAILLSDKQYDNNYFFESFGNMIIISFYGWDYLTTLSKNNGIVLFIADLIALDLDNSFRHDQTTGCIYDFGWNKTSIDLGMRNAFICPSCLSRVTSKKMTPEERNLFIDLREILNVLGNISKWNMDIVKYWGKSTRSTSKKNSTIKKNRLISENYDVFLAHHSVDKELVTKVCTILKNKGIKPWFDKEQIRPGRWFQDVIQDTIKKISSAAIFIGKNGLGKWQIVELRSFISQCVERNILIIPVLLPGVKAIPPELLFLNEFNWVKFKNKISEKDAIDNLIWGVTGIHPKRS